MGVSRKEFLQLSELRSGKGWESLVCGAYTYFDRWIHCRLQVVDLILESLYLLCGISVSLDGVYKDNSFLGFSAVQSRGSWLTFQRCVMPPSSGRSVRNVGLLPRDYTALHLINLPSSLLFSFIFNINSDGCARTRELLNMRLLLIMNLSLWYQ
jgi:hypothetical protein